MPYEVCYRALLSISVVEGLKPHTTLRPAAARRRAAASTTPCRGPRSPHAWLDHNVSVFRFHPQDSLAGGPPARWFVILTERSVYSNRNTSDCRCSRTCCLQAATSQTK